MPKGRGEGSGALYHQVSQNIHWLALPKTDTSDALMHFFFALAAATDYKQLPPPCTYTKTELHLQRANPSSDATDQVSAWTLSKRPSPFFTKPVDKATLQISCLML